MTTSGPDTAQRVAARASHRAQLNQRVLEVQRQLARRHGFDEYRVGEWLNSNTRRHVRMGYASDEWTITISDFPEQGYNGVARLRLRSRGVIRLDSRAYERGQQMPTAEELIALVLQ